MPRRIDCEIHHDLAYIIQRGIKSSGLSQGMSFSPSNITFSLPGMAYLLIRAEGNRLVYELQFYPKP